VCVVFGNVKLTAKMSYQFEAALRSLSNCLTFSLSPWKSL